MTPSNDERNLVVATTFVVRSVEQLRNDLVDPLLYRRLTAKPPDMAAVTVDIERPILHVQLDLPDGTRLHVINVHLKSKIPTNLLARRLMPIAGGPPTRGPRAPSSPR
jgi:endonuclease/exonuclease/phosphatase family metal-dependent hydrolase